MRDKFIFPIGGYFELELFNRNTFFYQDSIRYQSARSAFMALIRIGKPERIWIPRYICDAMVKPIEMSNVECIWYDIDDQLSVNDDIALNKNDWLLYVNYYGLCNKNINNLLSRFSPKQIVLDFSQSFFQSPVGVLATIYSPRKFFGIPDGGLLITRFLEMPLEKQQDDASVQRMSHLIKRLGGSAEVGYSDFERAEMSLSDIFPKRMSKLTEKILASVNFEYVKKKRNENFFQLHNKLGAMNLFKFDGMNVSAPLCYPFLTNDNSLRQHLIHNKIYIPTYWKDAMHRVSEEWAEKMIINCLPLPIDQRYGQEEMERIVSVILDNIS